jgi:hypothetical protein
MRYVTCIFSAILCCIMFLQASTQDGTALSLADIQKMYTAIRNVSLDSARVIQVDAYSFSKEGAEFILDSGYVYFFKPVNNRIVAAFFTGKGIFRLSPNDKIERQQIRRFTGEDILEQKFEQVLFLFTDSTYEIITSNQDIVAYPIDSIIEEVAELRERIRERFIWNVDARVLSDLISTQYEDFFAAFLECSADVENLLFIVDPLDEEAVSLLHYEQIPFSERADFEIWYSAHIQTQSLQQQPRFDIETMNLDVEIDAKKYLRATARVRFTSLVDGVRVVPIILSPFLQVETVIFDASDTCFFIQEDEEKDAELWIAFPEPLTKGKTHTLTVAYSGDDIIEDVGGDNFVVWERDSWYPSFYTNPYDPRRFTMKFAVPELMTLLSTGELQRRWIKDGIAYSEWDSKIEISAAGFNYGKFARETEKGKLCTIDCYTNSKLSNDLLMIRLFLEEHKELQSELMIFPQELTTEGMGKNAAIESRNAYEVYTHFFGEIPIRAITVSQQPQGYFGQSWPTLVFLPYTAFFDESLKERLGLIQSDRSVMWFETLASHEIAHQWWGHTVLTNSYHDIWLEEGFATYSAALYVQTTEGTERFKEYMKMLQEQVFAKTDKGSSANALGPIWLGERLGSFDTPLGMRLLYAKGAYVLHMLRMMLFDYDKKSDDRFIAMMKEYVNTYSGKIASTEDFKKIVEKYFDEDMDWFFDQWVYGTEVPFYTFDYQVEAGDGGNYLLTVNVEQKGVTQSFKMPLRLVINFENGHAVVGMFLEGPGVIQKQFRLPDKPISIVPNPWHGVLCVIEK